MTTVAGSRARPRALVPTGRWVLVVCTTAAVAAAPALATPARWAAATAAGSGGAAQLDVGDVRGLLEAAAAAMDQPHTGRVTVVTFSESGPRVADLDVRVGAVGEVELRRPTRWLLGAPSGSWMRTSQSVVPVTPTAAGLGMDVEAVLERWVATIGPPRGLDTGPATPVRLVRRSGAAIQEVVYVDHDTALPVRRETRAADGSVLRVVAYTSLSLVAVGGPGPVHTDVELRPIADHALQSLSDDGYDVPRQLGAGFQLLAVAHDPGMATARYGDGLSVLSVYQQHGRLDPSDLAGASVRTVAGRDVWTWPGSEPVRLVWTGDDRTWTVVSDAPVEVIQDALVSLPGDQVGHDVLSRIGRGLSRTWIWLRDLVGV